MTEIDTSAEALDALLSELHFHGSLREDEGAPDADTSKVLAQAWATLRALAAERDAADEMARAMTVDSQQRLTERDAARADRDRLAADALARALAEAEKRGMERAAGIAESVEVLAHESGRSVTVAAIRAAAKEIKA